MQDDLVEQSSLESLLYSGRTHDADILLAGSTAGLLDGVFDPARYERIRRTALGAIRRSTVCQYEHRCTRERAAPVQGVRDLVGAPAANDCSEPAGELVEELGALL